MTLEEFGELVQVHKERVRTAGHHDARRQMFFDFAQKAYGIDLGSWEVEAKVYRGWVDAVLGNLVFEFKTDLPREMGDAHAELRRYLRQLHARHPSVQYTAIVSDGVRFCLYRPEYAKGGVELEELRDFAIADVDQSRPDTVAACYYQLDALLASFQRERIPPTVEHIVASLGAGSSAFRSALGELHGLYKRAADDPAVQVRFSQWNRYLGIVLGEAPQDRDLFVRHTYLGTLNKLVAYLTLEPDSAATTDGELQGILTGALFAERGIHNLIEEDFFTWFLTSSIHAEGLVFLRRLAGTLRRYDFRQVSQDVLKELYQEIVERDARHDIGEYYTPDWLGELVLREGVDLCERPTASILDPACGSGTFLFLAVRLVTEALRSRAWNADDILGHVLENIQGVDVHPVAVITARTNYLLALGDLLSGRRREIAIPVYLADAVLPPERQTTSQPVAGRRGRRRAEATGRLEGEPVLPWQPGEERFTFEYPASLVSQPQALDGLVNTMRDQLTYLEPGRDDYREQIRVAIDAYQAAVRGYLRQTGTILSDEAVGYLCDMFRQVAELYCQGKDTVWLFLLKNAPRPVFLQERKFDIVVGNPPWLSLRYFRGAGYARRIKQLALDEYNLRPYAQTHLATQMELATLFFARAVDFYLRPGGTIGFVMPRSVMVASQHARFNEFWFKGGSLPVHLDQVLDLEEVSPLFNVPSCVLVATKGKKTEWPVEAQRFSGRLDGRNRSWADAAPRLSRKLQQLQRVEGKLLPVDVVATLGQVLGESPYANEFENGATIYPRVFWFVRQREGRFGFPTDAPLLETDEDSVRQAKEPWRSIRLRGPVEERFIYSTIPSGDLVPFGYTRVSTVVLPILAEGTRYRVLDVGDALDLGYPRLAAWLRDAQRHWEEHARRDADGQLKELRVVRWLDYRRKLSHQRSDVRYKVMYNKSGTNLLGAMVDTESLALLSAGRTDSDLAGFVADHECYLFECEDQSEAYYLTSVLNAPVVDGLLKPLQTRGLWGERDIHKRVWQLRIPRFDPDNAGHRQLAEVSRASHG